MSSGGFTRRSGRRSKTPWRRWPPRPTAIRPRAAATPCGDVARGPTPRRGRRSLHRGPGHQPRGWPPGRARAARRPGHGAPSGRWLHAGHAGAPHPAAAPDRRDALPPAAARRRRPLPRSQDRRALAPDRAGAGLTGSPDAGPPNRGHLPRRCGCAVCPAVGPTPHGGVARRPDRGRRGGRRRGVDLAPCDALRPPL